MLPRIGVRRRDGSVFQTLARLGHPVFDCSSPGRVVLRFFVARYVIVGSVDLEQHESVTAALFADEVEADDTRFLAARFGVGQTGGNKGIGVLRHDTDLDDHDQHDRVIRRCGLGCQPG